ncbi:glycosyltransferase family 4 protein [Tateyamaria sp. Alg231-49]|uniref:glycosyltransferase family 4 protein n=1 Tax=Tateyamaria sp. Alg231-49 TaxID=1922219 RepID=UPI000D557CB2|nr:glycosyltransferase family 4 protein [Tateyamaria sp. Alg231-49]
MLNAAPPRPAEIRFFPDYRDFNPYQALLYRSLGPTVVASPLANFEALTSEAGTENATKILHLHWETAAISNGGFSPEAFLDTLSQFRNGGGRIVWTMHNLLPHTARERAVAEQIRGGLLTLVDIVHLHSLPALAAAMQHHALPLNKVRIIPHGNYDGIYPAILRDKARAVLDLDAARTVVLLPGQIRAYKAPSALIDAFLETAGPDDRLILAGYRVSDVADLSLPDDPRIIASFGFLTNEDLSQVYAAADIVALPYTDSLTSGSAILAQTLGRGVLGSDTAGLRDVVTTPATGVLYDQDAPDGLADALQAALNEGPETWAARGKEALQAVRARDWAMIGPTWRALFEELSHMHQHARVSTP